MVAGSAEVVNTEKFKLRGLDLNQRPPGYEFKWAGSKNMLSLAESVVLSARPALIHRSKRGFAPILRPNPREPV